jgi:hypothetical protein
LTYNIVVIVIVVVVVVGKESRYKTDEYCGRQVAFAKHCHTSANDEYLPLALEELERIK